MNVTMPRGNRELPKAKLQIQREDRAKFLSHRQVLSTSRFHLNLKRIIFIFFYSHFIILCVPLTTLAIILHITKD